MNFRGRPCFQEYTQWERLRPPGRRDRSPDSRPSKIIEPRGDQRDAYTDTEKSTAENHASGPGTHGSFRAIV